MAPMSDEAYLFVLGARVVHRIELHPRTTLLGSQDGANDIVLRAASVLPKHAKFAFHDGQYKIEPMGNQETYKNGRLVWPRDRLADGDIVRFGRVDLLFALRADKSPAPMVITVEREGRGRIFEIQSWLPEVRFGRTHGDLIFEDRALSSEHMLIEHYGPRLFITDLESTNGVQVAGDVIQPNVRLELAQGADVVAGSMTFRVRL